MRAFWFAVNAEKGLAVGRMGRGAGGSRSALTNEDEALLVGKNPFLTPHTTTETQDELVSWLLLNIAVRRGAAVLELFTGEDKPWLVGGKARSSP